MRRVVFIGNCQLEVLSQLYRRFSERGNEEQVVYLPSYEDLTDGGAAAIAAADVIIEQRMDAAQRAETGGVVNAAERHFVPLLAGGFLWPYAGQPHPRNEKSWFMPNGPYDAELADRYLNQLIDQGVSPAEAVDRYLAIEVGSVRHLDRLFELIIDRQRSRDAACGYRIADLIEERFRDEPMFRTPYHPNLRLTLSLATQFFERMDIRRAAIDRLHEQVRVTPFPKNQLPIHPAVALHFKLKYADARSRYRIRDEGRFTFTEYALAYMAYDWNPDLAEGIELVGSDVAQALPKLAAGVRHSPNSATGWYSYSVALRQANRSAEAEGAVRRAIAIDPAEGRHHHDLGLILLDSGRLDEAVEAVERAVFYDPFDKRCQSLFAMVVSRRGRQAEAEDSDRRAIELDPTNPRLHRPPNDLLPRQQRPADAIVASQAAVDLDSNSAEFHVVLSRSLAQAGRMPEAIEATRRAALLEPDNASLQGHLNSILAQSGDAKLAEAGLRALLAAQPNRVALHEQYGHLLIRLRRPDEAEIAFRRAMDLAPDAVGPIAALSHTLARLGRHHEAIAAIEMATDLQPEFAPFHVHRGNQLWVLEQFEAAASAYQAALALDPTNRDAERQLRGIRSALAAIG